MSKFARYFVIVFIALSLALTSEICSAQEYYGPPPSSYSVSSAEVIVGVAVVAAIVTAAVLLSKHHGDDPAPRVPYLSFAKSTPPYSPMYIGDEPQYLDYTIQNTRDEGTDIVIDGYQDSMIVRNRNIPYDCGDYLSRYDSCNIELIVYPSEARPIRRILEVTDELGFSITQPINIDVYHPYGTNNPLKVVTPYISNMTLNKDKSQTLEYVLQNHSNQSIDISKIEGFNSDTNYEPVSRDNSITGNCGTTLAADSSCKLRLKINPTQPGEISKQLTIGNGSAKYFTSPINLFVHALDIVYQQSTPVLYALPQQIFNDGRITLKNYYSKPVKTDAIISPANGVDLKFLSTTCGESLAPNASCEYRLQYQAAASNKLKLGTSDRPFVTGVNSAINIKYKLDDKNIYLKFPIQTFLPSDSRILSYPANTTTFNSLPSINISKKVKIGDVIYAGTQDAGLAISKDNGISWKTYTIGNGLGSNHVTDVTASIDGSKIYVATDNGLAISNDFGATWKNYNKNSSLGSNLINTVTVSADDTNIQVTTADRGLASSNDAGETWKH